MLTLRHKTATLALAFFACTTLAVPAFAANEDIPDPFAQLKSQQTGAAGGNAAPAESPFAAPMVLPDPPVFEAQSWLLMDYASGQVIFEHDSGAKIWPASLTKMMTSYVIGMEFKAGRLKPTDQVIIPEDAWSKNYSDSSKKFIEVGKSISVDDLNKGIIIQSGNDACVAMALHLAGSQEGFVSVMNSYAQRLGLNHTQFSNVHGLFDESNYSTAYDMALLGRALIRDLPDEYAIYKQKEFSFNGIKQYNRNRLLWDNTIAVDGIKTGHLSQVGYNLVASAQQNGMRLIAVVIGAQSESKRANFCKQMLNYGFRYFESYVPVPAGQTILTREVRMGDASTVELYVKDAPSVMVPKGSQKNVKLSYRLASGTITAPIAQDQVLGVLEMSLNDKILAQYPLCAKQAVGEGGLVSRMWDKAIVFFKNATSSNDDEAAEIGEGS